MIYFAFIPIGFFMGAILGTIHKKKRESYQIKFIDSDKIEDFLSEDEISVEKDASCSVCGVKVTRDNVGMLTKRGGEIIYVCNKSHCQTFNTLTT